MNWDIISEFVDSTRLWAALSLWVICFGFYFSYKRLSEWIAPPWKKEMNQQKQETDKE